MVKRAPKKKSKRCVRKTKQQSDSDMTKCVTCGKPSECYVKVNEELKPFCREHYPKSTPICTERMCVEDGCIFHATNTSPDKRNAKYCAFHKKDGMHHVSHDFCDFPGCETAPTFGIPENKAPIYCEAHCNRELHRNVVNVMCIKCKTSQATHNDPDQKKPLYCGTCAPDTMMNIVSTKCEAILENGKRCTSTRSYGEPGSHNPTHCAKHGDPLGLVDIKHPKCKVCGKQGAFIHTDEQGKKHYYCSKDGDEVEARCQNKRCPWIDPDGTKCEKHPSFTVADNETEYCKPHAEKYAKEHNIDPSEIKNPGAILCKDHGKRCSFGFPGQPPRFCGDCRATHDGLVSSDTRKCIHRKTPDAPICGKRAGFGLPGDDKPHFCGDCAKEVNEDMINLVKRLCDRPGCRKSPSFGYPPGYEAPQAAGTPHRQELRCKDDALPGMIDIRHPRCEECGERAFYRRPGEIRATFCYYCHPPGAVPDTARCEGFPGHPCEARALYGPLFKPAIHCAQCAKACDDNGNPLFCEFDRRYPKCEGCANCPRRPKYSISDDNYPTFCPEHAPPMAREVYLEARACAKCNKLSIICIQTHLCVNCELGIERPDNRRIHKRKETSMCKLLLKHGLAPICDKQLQCDRSLKIRSRPDFLFEHDNCTIILEVDEFQHGRAIRISDLTDIRDFFDEARIDDEHPPEPIRRQGYTRNKELTRMVLIQKAITKPTIFIRYNPDAYVDIDNVRHEGTHIRIHNGKALELLRKIQHIAENFRFNSPLYVAYLYYDGQKDGVPDAFEVDYEETQTIKKWNIFLE